MARKMLRFTNREHYDGYIIHIDGERKIELTWKQAKRVKKILTRCVNTVDDPVPFWREKWRQIASDKPPKIKGRMPPEPPRSNVRVTIKMRELDDIQKAPYSHLVYGKSTETNEKVVCQRIVYVGKNLDGTHVVMAENNAQCSTQQFVNYQAKEDREHATAFILKNAALSSVEAPPRGASAPGVSAQYSPEEDAWLIRVSHDDTEDFASANAYEFTLTWDQANRLKKNLADRQSVTFDHKEACRRKWQQIVRNGYKNTSPTQLIVGNDFNGRHDLLQWCVGTTPFACYPEDFVSNQVENDRPKVREFLRSLNINIE